MKVLTFWHMPYKDKKMFFLNICLCGIAKIATRCMTYKRLSAYFGKSCQILIASTLISKEQIEEALYIRRSICLATRYTPWDSSCLTQALVAQFWCRRYQLPYLFFIGLSKQSSPFSGKNAHAWITAGPIAITGGHSLDTHHIICSYTNMRIRS